MVRSDSAKATILDWVVVGAGLLAYISSFFPWYQSRVSVSVLGIERSGSENAWSSGFGAWLAVLLLVAAGGVVLASTMGGRLATSRSLITLGLSALAFITILLRWVTFPDVRDNRDDLDNIDVDGLFAVSSGAGFGLYLGLIAAVAAVVASFLTFRAARGSVDQPGQTPSID
ncbi:MAG: hypothetical protein ACRDTD_16320 [Pseudonocardiaceae bacterium]